MIKLVKNIEKANCITHGGKFHSDEVFATVVLDKVINNMKLIRVFEAPINSENRIVYDIGGGKYDHHQNKEIKKRKNGIEYASFGLIWREFGKEYLREIETPEDIIDEVLKSIDENFVQFIDSRDNGQDVYENAKIKVVSVCDIISAFNPSWNEDEEFDDCFLKAFNMADLIFKNEVKKETNKILAKNIIENKLKSSINNIIVLEKFMPFQENIFESKNPNAKNILYVIYPSVRGGYAIQATRIKKDSLECKKPFPQKWCEAKVDNLSKVTGIKTIKFCHRGGFLCNTETLNDAIKLAKIAIEFK